MLKLNHKNLDVWKESIKLAKLVYKLTDKLPTHEQYGLISQIRRSSVSISYNLSEGYARNSKADRSRFYEIALSSLDELDTQIELSI